MNTWETLVFEFVNERPMCHQSEILYEFGGSYQIINAIRYLTDNKKIRRYNSRKKNDPQFQVIKKEVAAIH
jgi:hypothetical protein